jgi:hypothetical protein
MNECCSGTSGVLTATYEDVLRPSQYGWEFTPDIPVAFARQARRRANMKLRLFWRYYTCVSVLILGNTNMPGNNDQHRYIKYINNSTVLYEYYLTSPTPITPSRTPGHGHGARWSTRWSIFSDMFECSSSSTRMYLRTRLRISNWLSPSLNWLCLLAYQAAATARQVCTSGGKRRDSSNEHVIIKIAS